MAIMAKTAAASAAKWAQNLAASTQAVTDGVNGVTVAPGQAAARQVSVWQANTVAAAPKWAKNTAAVSLSSWQNDMITKGIPRIATGATAAQPKMEAFLTKLLPAIAAAKSTLPPRGTLDQNLVRATQFARALAGQSFT